MNKVWLPNRTDIFPFQPQWAHDSSCKHEWKVSNALLLPLSPLRRYVVSYSHCFRRGKGPINLLLLGEHELHSLGLCQMDLYKCKPGLNFTVLDMVAFLCRAQRIDFSSLNDYRNDLPCWYKKTDTHTYIEVLKGNVDSLIVGGDANILGCSVTSQCFLTSWHQPEIRPNHSRFPRFCQELLAAFNRHTLVLKVLVFGF